MSCPINSSTNSFEFGEDGVGGGSPLERLRMGVVVSDELLDLAHQLGKGAAGVTADGALCDEAEPALDLVDPRRIGGREMQIVTGSLCEPGAILACLWVE